MIYRQLGKTGLKVSAIGFGCWQLGGELSIAGEPQSYGKIDENEARSALLLALELGINFFDTADFYGLGKSESVLGEELEKVRNKVVISTKVGSVPDKDKGCVFNCSYDYIMESCEKSLKRLRTDYIDLYLLHFVPDELEKKEAIKAFKELKEQGKIKEYGISVAHLIEKIPELAKDFPILEGYYNMLLRKFEDFPTVTEKGGTCFIAASPLSRGLLSGKDYDNVKFDKSDVRKKWEKGRKHYEWYNAQKKSLGRFKEFSQKWNIPLKSLALSYIMSNNNVATTIPGMKTKLQVTELVRSLNYVPLDKEKINQIKGVK